MCGILGIVNTDGRRFDTDDEETLRHLLATLSRRGPDGNGRYRKDNVGLGHHRLAVRDPAQGHQPWSSENEQCVLVYNGELYNDHQLRSELATEYSFATRCDTEVVMASYLRWGRDCVQRFRGMFAFGIYDFRDHCLWIVRDRFGVKPLYFAEIGNQFIFASQVGTLVTHPQFAKRPDWNALSHYLSTTRLTIGSRTLYEGIRQLQPAEELVLKNGRANVRRYWEYPQRRVSMSYEDAADQLQLQLTDSVNQRLVSDVPVGLFLSGGVDSSTIASLVHRGDHRTRYATCATTQVNDPSKDAGRDELAFAQSCARQVNAELEPVRLDDEQYRTTWLELIRAFRSPLTTPSDVLIYEIAKAAKQRVGVVLGGEGSDELLCGYEVAHWAGHDYDAATEIERGRGNTAMLRSIAKQYGRSRFISEADHYFALNSLLPTQQKPRILNAAIVDDIDNDLSMYSYYQRLYDSYEDLPTVEKNAILLHRINLESLLARLDSTTMHAGLEARVPFTDHELVESMFRLPFGYRIDASPPHVSRSLASAELAAGGLLRSKRILRTVAQRLLPDELANRKKASFPTGVQHWFQTDWIRWIADYLSHSPFAKFFLSESFRAELIRAPQLAGMWLWPITNLSLWGDLEFFDAPLR